MTLNMSGEREPLSKVISDGSLVEPFSFVEELGDIFWSVPEQLILHQKHDALQRRRQSITTKIR